MYERSLKSVSKKPAFANGGVVRLINHSDFGKPELQEVQENLHCKKINRQEALKEVKCKNYSLKRIE